MLFIDEIHRIARPAEEMLYLAMEDFRVDVVVGKGPGATSIPLDIAPFTLVGATTRSGALTGPLRDRFGFTAHMEFYEPAELELVLRRAAAILDVDLRPDGAEEIAGRSRGTPRIANRLLRRVRDFAEVRADGAVTRQVARDALAVYDVDELGLDRLDRAVLARAGAARSAAARSGCPRWPSRSARNPVPSRRSASRSWCGPGCWPAPPGAGWPPRRPGPTWGSLRRRTSPRVALPRCSERGLADSAALRRAEIRRPWTSPRCCSRCSSCCCSSRSSCPVAGRGGRWRRCRRCSRRSSPVTWSMTTSGLRGTVVDASYEDTIDLEIADGVVTTWRARRGEGAHRRRSGGRAEPEIDVVPGPVVAAPHEAVADDGKAQEARLSLEKDDSTNGTPRI